MVATQADAPAQKPASFLTVEQVAERLGLSEKTVYRLCDLKQISFLKLGAKKGIRFTEEQIAEFVKRSTVQAVPKRK